MIKKTTNPLNNLMNVGKATLQDLHLLNIQTIEQLSKANPDELYTRLEAITKKHHDPCMWDVFAAIIHEARTGQKTPWWNWTAVRKRITHPLCSHKKKV